MVGLLRDYATETHPLAERDLGKSPQWGAAAAEIKVPSGENTELKGSP